MSLYLISLLALSVFGTDEEIEPSYVNENNYSIEVTIDTIIPKIQNDQSTKEVFKVVENMPMFPGSSEQDLEDRKMRAYELQLEYIYSKLIYPEKAIKNEVEGTVEVQFNVAPDGSIQDITLLKDIGFGCGEEARRLIESMPRWEPGTQRGKKVLVQVKTPIYFRLAFLEEKNAKTDKKELYKVVEQMPRFPGCNEGDEPKNRKCAQEKMLHFIYSNIEYPVKARRKHIEGTTVVRFTIDIDGSLEDVECVRDIGAGCGSEALRIIKSMPKWEPGVQRGKPVKVQFNMPIKFGLTPISQEKDVKEIKG